MKLMPKQRLVFLPLAVALALLAYSIARPDQLGTLLGYGGYYFMVALVGAIAYGLFSLAPESNNLKALWREQRGGILISALLVGVVFVTVKPELRVFSDEALIAGVSRSMLYERSTFIAVEGKWYYDNFFPTVKEFDKRPYLFPFLGTLVHLVSGYRPENLIALNGLFLFLLLFTVYRVIHHHLGTGFAVVGQILLLSHPILSICATSAGAELFSVLCLAWALLSAQWFLEGPGAERLLLLWASSLALLHARYESAGFVAVIWVALFGLKKIKSAYLKPHAFLYASTPLLILPLLWQRWSRMGQHETPTDVAPFSLGHLWNHLVLYAKSQFQFTDELPFANLLILLGALCALVTSLELLLGKKRFQKKSSLHVFVLSVVCLFLYLSVMLSYHFSNYWHPAAARYFLLPSLAFSGFIVLFIYFHPIPKFWASAGAVALFGLYHPIAMLPITLHALHKTREVTFVQRFLDSLPHKNFLLIASDSENYTMREVGAVGFRTANREHNELYVQSAHHLFQDVYIVQHIRYQDERPIAEHELVSGYETQTVSALENSERHYVRISKVMKFPQTPRGG